MEKMKLKIKKLNKETKIPFYARPGDAGLDLYSLENIFLKPGDLHVFPLGFALEFSSSYVALIKDKSSLSVKFQIHTVGGVFDSSYRGEYSVNLINLSKKSYQIEKGDKIAQLLIMPVAQGELEVTDELSVTERGKGRFGSTGRK